ncbi:MAG: efflux RND transporter periplasmic adaptor subunit [Gammaproteobacteria bacterium]|nr:efflux RND transporter periplasmic adaptor subunit [Gammaproteobacteria bacterium]
MSESEGAVAKYLRGFRRGVLLAFGILLLLTAVGVYLRLQARAGLRADTAQLAEISVNVTRPLPGGEGATLVLPGEVRAYADAAVYARTSGYLKRRLVDIGQVVHAGQLLAEIDSPEVDAQLRQAEADRTNAAVAEQLARATAVRWQELYVRGVVPRQEADDRNADAAARRAALDAAQANLLRLQELASFKRVVAPFDGIVTARSTDVGALINAGAAAGAELFHVTTARRLRVQVRVPEADAAAVRIGAAAGLLLRDRPDRPYAATVTRTAGAIDALTRTLLVELEVDNASGEVLPGSYATVRLAAAGRRATLRLPEAALQFYAGGVRVATLGSDGRIAFRRIALGRDLGQEIEVLSGLGADEQVILDPSDALVEGERVRVVSAIR